MIGSHPMQTARTLRLTTCVAVLTLSQACADATPILPDPADTTVASLEIQPETVTFDAFQASVQLTASAHNADGDVLEPELSWAVQGSGVASITPDGLLTSVGNGIDTVMVTAGQRTAILEVRVEQVATRIAIQSPVPLFQVLGQRARLAATFFDRNSQPAAPIPVTWTSLSTALRVDSTGTATAMHHGVGTVSASAGGLQEEISLPVTFEGPVGPAIVGAPVPCVGGFAGPFPCAGIELAAYLPISALGFGGFEVNDVWGWVDPATGKEYVIVGRIDGIGFVDVSDPHNPIVLGHLPITPGATPEVWHGVRVYQDHAFIVADVAGQHGMQVFDLRQLRGVTIPQQFTATALYAGIGSAHNIFINEVTGFAYVVGASSGGNTCGGGLHMINIQNPVAPVFAGCFADALTGRVGTGYTHDVQCVVYHGPDPDYAGREICLGSNETALSIADVSDKAAPVALARASYPNLGYAHQGWLTSDQRYFLMNDELDELNGATEFSRTIVWDVSDLDDPVLVHEFFGPTNATDHNHYIRNGMMFTSNYQFGLRVVNVSNPLAPAQVGFLDTAPTQPNTPGLGGSWSNFPFFPSGIIAVTSRQEGLFLVRTMN